MLKLIWGLLSWVLVGLLTGIGVKLGQTAAEKAMRKYSKGRPATVDARFEAAKPCQEKAA